MQNLLDRITIDPEICHSKPTIRGFIPFIPFIPWTYQIKIEPKIELTANSIIVKE